MNDPVARFTISLAPDLLAEFDDAVAGKGYMSRSEAIRDAMRNYLLAHNWADGDGNHGVVGTITLVIDPAQRGLVAELLKIRQRAAGIILSAVEHDLGAQGLLLVLSVRGPGRAVADLADELVSLKGVILGRLFSVAVTQGR